MENCYFVEGELSQRQLRKIEEKLKADFSEYRIVCISAEILFEEIIWYIKDGIESEWVEKYKEVDILFVSNLQYFIWENTRIQNKLFQLLKNNIVNKRVILNSTKSIDQLEGLSIEMKDFLCNAKKTDISSIISVENDRIADTEAIYIEAANLDEATKLELKALESLCRKSWTTLKEEIAKKENISKIYFETFIAPLEVKKLVKMREEVLVILEMTDSMVFSRNYVEHRYGRLIERYISQLIGEKAHIKVQYLKPNLV